VSVPTITENGIGTFLFAWEEGIRIEASRLRNHSDGRVTGELLITTSKPGTKYPHLHRAQFNFTSTTARDRLAHSLDGRYAETDWLTILEQLCVYTLDRIRQGEPLLNLWQQDGLYEAPRYLIDPLLVEDYPTVIYGDPGSFKSSIGLYIYACLLLPWSDNPLSLGTNLESTKVVYLDWETEPKTTRWQLYRIERGMNLPTIPLVYRRCGLPLAEDIEAIQRAIQEAQAKVGIIDSLGLACGGELKEAAPAIAFFTALRQLKITSLILAHTAKNPETKHRSIYGSVFFEAQARSVWEIKKVQEVGEDEIDVALFHRKPPPFQRLHPAIGMNVKFTPDSISIKQQEVKTVREFIAALGTQAQIESLLTHEPLDTKSLMETLGISRNATDIALKKLRDKKRIIKLESGKWGLAANE